MLERKVLIDGTVYDRHELVMVTIQPSSPGDRHGAVFPLRFGR